ncbi:hypothetical protein INS49_014258 [Diaporthe citri]|uniref:uncharacterized protein n=1 Tax=Diaporthe citri TaxID=83186 RepID=UPI001C7F27AB|nr:uncharacterized protein INS49_014258 [Diaporthe citri]KAG6358374.1 hypothetical protein INS49_014258 [Diaporthe citri]
MRPTSRLAWIRGWTVPINSKRVDGLPYSKIKAVCQQYRQRLLASRTEPVAPRALPPATLFHFGPTPSYVVSPQLAARLTTSGLSSLKSNLKVYEFEFTGKTSPSDANCTDLKELDCTPEVLIDQSLRGDRAVYYGRGQIHVVGMVDMHRVDLKQKTQYGSSAQLQSRLGGKILRKLRLNPERPASNSPDGLSSWIFFNTNGEQQKIGQFSAEIDHSEGIATTSVTLNLSVPMPGFDPDRLCPHTRLTESGIGTGPVTTLWASEGKQSPDGEPLFGAPKAPSLCLTFLLGVTRDAMGIGPLPEYMDHSIVLGKSDPDLESNDEEEEEDDGEVEWLREEFL